MSIYSASGLSRSPMFINWTPFQLDFDPFRRNQEIMLQMMPAYLASQQAAGSGASAAKSKLKEGDALANDMRHVDERSAELESIMQQEMNGQNANWVMKNSPAYRQAMSEYANMYSPSANLARLEEKTGVEALEARIKDTQKHGSTGFLYTDAEGRVRANPYDPSRPLEFGEFLTLRRGDPGFSMYTNAQGFDARNVVLGDPHELNERIKASVGETGKTATSGSREDAKTLVELANATNQGLPSVIARVLTKPKSESNYEQLRAGLEAEIGSLDLEEMAAIRNHFVSSGQYKLHEKEVTKDGKFDQEALDTFLFTGSGAKYNSAFMGKAKVTYAEKYIADQAYRYLSTMRGIDPELVKSYAPTGDGSGNGGGNDPNLISIFEALVNPPHGRDQEGNEYNYGKVENYSVPVMGMKDGKPLLQEMVIKDGQASTTVNPLVQSKMNDAFQTASSKKISPNEAKHSAEVPDASTVLAGREIVLPGGNTTTGDAPGLEGAKVLNVGSRIFWRKVVDKGSLLDPKVAMEKYGVTYDKTDTSNYMSETLLNPRISDPAGTTAPTWQGYVQMDILVSDNVTNEAEALQDYDRVQFSLDPEQELPAPVPSYNPQGWNAAATVSDQSARDALVRQMAGTELVLRRYDEMETTPRESRKAGGRANQILDAGLDDQIMTVLVGINYTDLAMRSGDLLVDRRLFQQQPGSGLTHASPQEAVQANSGYMNSTGQNYTPPATTP